MIFSEYLEKNGPSVKELAEMDSGERLIAAATAYGSYVGDIESNYGYYGVGFVDGWNLCQEVMVYQHLAQDVRAAAEKDSVKQ